MKTNPIVEKLEGSRLSDQPKRKKRIDLRQGMIMKVILGPPRAKENLLHRRRLP